MSCLFTCPPIQPWISRFIHSCQGYLPHSLWNTDGMKEAVCRLACIICCAEESYCMTQEGGKDLGLCFPLLADLPSHPQWLGLYYAESPHLQPSAQSHRPQNMCSEALCFPSVGLKATFCLDIRSSYGRTRLAQILTLLHICRGWRWFSLQQQKLSFPEGASSLLSGRTKAHGDGMNPSLF